MIILLYVLQNDVCIILTRSSFKFENNLNDLNLSNLISNSTALLYQRWNETTKKTFTIDFEFDFILYKIEKFEETCVTICKQRFINVHVKLIIKNKIFRQQIVELKKLYKTNNN